MCNRKQGRLFLNIIKKVLNFIVYQIYRLHLYDSKGEAFLKAFIITLSWKIGVVYHIDVVAYFLFSMAIIMEYIVQLLCARELIPKILPLILVISNAFIAIVTSSQDGFVYPLYKYIEAITIAIIVIDAVVMIILEPPESQRIESTISKCGKDIFK